MKIDTMKLLKVGTLLGSLGVSLAKGYLEDKQLEKKVAEEVEKALKNIQSK